VVGNRMNADGESGAAKVRDETLLGRHRGERGIGWRIGVA
jgi:hypothetical protein